MTVYVFVEHNVSNDPNIFFDSEFYHEVTSWMRRHGGERIGAAFNNTIVIKGTQNHNRALLIRFEDMSKVKAWVNGLKEIVDKSGEA